MNWDLENILQLKKHRQMQDDKGNKNVIFTKNQTNLICLER